MPEQVTTPPHQPSRRSPLRERDFALLWWAGLISAMGSHAMFVALPVTLYLRTGSATAAAVTAAAGLLPSVLLGPLGGAVADRHDPRRLLLWGNAGLAALCACFLLLDWTGWWLAPVITFASGALGTLTGPAETVLLPRLVGVDRLGAAASLNALNNSLGRLAGPALGGWLVATASFGAATLVRCACFGVAVLAMALLRHRDPTPEAEQSRAGMIAAVREGLSVVRRDHLLRALLVIAVVTAVGESAVSALLAPWAVQLLGDRGAGLGLILSVQAIGGIGGALWATRRLDRVSSRSALGASGAVITGLLALTFGLALIWPSIPLVAVLTALAGAPFAVFAAAQGRAMLLAAPDRVRGRVAALFGTAAGLVQAGLVPVFGALGDAAGIQWIWADPVAYLAAALLALVLLPRPPRAATPDCRAPDACTA